LWLDGGGERKLVVFQQTHDKNATSARPAAAARKQGFRRVSGARNAGLITSGASPRNHHGDLELLQPAGTTFAQGFK
jgi:hypothetical protein